MTNKVTKPNLEELFCTLWHSFPAILRSEYINNLKENNPKSKSVIIKTKLLSTGDSKEVFKKIKTFDSDLKIFKSFIERFDHLSPKAVRFLKTPKFSSGDELKIKKIPAQEYLLTDSLDWSIQEVIQKAGEKTKIVVSRNSLRVINKKLEAEDVAGTTWEALEKDVKKYFHNLISSLHNFRVTVSAPYKFQVSIEFDWKSNTTELASDLTEWDDTEGKSRDRIELKINALQFIATELGLTNIASFSGIASRGETSDKDLKNKIEGENNRDYLIVIRGGSYHIVGDERNNEESVKANLRLFDIAQITSGAEKFYGKEGTFEAYRHFDRSYTKIQGGALSDEETLDFSGVFL